MNGTDLLIWRRKRGWTQWRLGEELGLKNTTISSWETGKTCIPKFIGLALSGLDAKYADGELDD